VAVITESREPNIVDLLLTEKHIIFEFPEPLSIPLDRVRTLDIPMMDLGAGDLQNVKHLDEIVSGYESQEQSCKLQYYDDRGKIIKKKFSIPGKQVHSLHSEFDLAIKKMREKAKEKGLTGYLGGSFRPAMSYKTNKYRDRLIGFIGAILLIIVGVVLFANGIAREAGYWLMVSGGLTVLPLGMSLAMTYMGVDDEK
jgi:hypothetical protein